VVKGWVASVVVNVLNHGLRELTERLTIQSKPAGPTPATALIIDECFKKYVL